MESVIIYNTFASVMWITGAFLVAIFVDWVVDFFLSVFKQFQ